MSGQQHQPGELVDITIRGARIGGRGIPQDPRRLYFDIGPWDDGVNQGSEWFLTIPASVDAVTVTRVAPPEWPPRQGDVWVDRDDDAWVARDERTLTQEGVDDDADYVLKHCAPLRLVHRKAGESDE